MEYIHERKNLNVLMYNIKRVDNDNYILRVSTVYDLQIGDTIVSSIFLKTPNDFSKFRITEFIGDAKTKENRFERVLICMDANKINRFYAPELNPDYLNKYIDLIKK